MVINRRMGQGSLAFRVASPRGMEHLLDRQMLAFQKSTQPRLYIN